MFPDVNHDADLLRRTLGTDKIAGFFAAGEIRLCRRQELSTRISLPVQPFSLKV